MHKAVKNLPFATLTLHLQEKQKQSALQICYIKTNVRQNK